MSLSTFLGGTITQLRGLAWLALSDTGHIGSGTLVDDGGGGVTTGWAYGDSISCRVDPLAGNESLVAGRISDRSTHVVTAPAETPVQISSRFAIDSRGTYEVTAVRDQTGEMARFFEVVQVV